MTLEHDLSGGYSAIATAAEAVDAYCQARGLPEAVAFKFNLAIDELATNTLSYGHGGASADKPSISLRMRVTPEGWVEAVLRDDAAAYDPFRQAPPPVTVGTAEDRPIGGLGVHFVKEMMDEVLYHRDGDWNVITLRMRP